MWTRFLSWRPSWSRPRRRHNRHWPWSTLGRRAALACRVIRNGDLVVVGCAAALTDSLQHIGCYAVSRADRSYVTAFHRRIRKEIINEAVFVAANEFDRPKVPVCRVET